jgi:uncharacterized protein (DUF1778 family)
LVIARQCHVEVHIVLTFNAYPQSGQRSVRMEQRTSPEIKELIEAAAAQLGITASEFTVSHAAWAARETLSRAEGTRLLSDEDRAAFMSAFEDTEPNEDLVDLMALHEEISSK